MDVARRVGDIFCAAGAEFQKLSEKIIVLHATETSPSGGRTVAKKRPSDEPATPVGNYSVARSTQAQVRQQAQSSMRNSSEVTLNMLNAAHEIEVDVDEIHQGFDSAQHEEVHPSYV